MGRRRSTACGRFLGAELRDRRQAAGWTASALADQLGWPRSAVSRLELGERNIRSEDVAIYLTFLGIRLDEQAPLLALARRVDDDCWVCPHGEWLPDELPGLVHHQVTAAEIHCYQPSSIPALLRTRDYATARLWDRLGPDSDVAGRVRALLDRQRRAFGQDAPGSVFYLSETTLRALPGKPAIRAGQLRWLATLAARGQRHIRVVPANIEQSDIAVGGFWMMRFHHGGWLICAQTDTVSVFLERDFDVDRYRGILARLDGIALAEPDSAELLAVLAVDHSGLTRRPVTCAVDVTRSG